MSNAVRFLAVLSVACLVSIYALSQVRTGTIVVVLFTEEKLVFAGDSLVSAIQADGRTERDYRDCKIATFGNKVIFAGSGTLGETGVWVSAEQAKIAYEMATIKRGADLPIEVTRNWAEAVKGPLAMTYLTHKAVMDARMPDGKLGNAYFGGVDGKGDLWLTFTKFFVVSGVVKYESYKFSPAACTPICGTGEIDVAVEFSQLASDRAKAESASWSPSKSYSPEDRDILRMIRLVDLSIADDEARQIGKIGGPIDAVELKSGGAVRWFSRKSNCPENQD